MDSTKAALLCVIAILAIGLCVTSYMAFVEKSTPGDEENDPVEEFSFVDTWEWRVGYSVSSENMNEVKVIENRDPITFTKKYGKLLHVVDGDETQLATMTNDVTVVCLHGDNGIEVDSYFYAATDNLLLRYVLLWNTSNDTTLAGVGAYIRQGTTVSDSVIDELLTCPDICRDYVQDSVRSTNKTFDFTSKTTKISDLGHGLIYLEESLTRASGEVIDARCIGFFTPVNSEGGVWGAYTQNPKDMPENTATAMEFIYGKDFFNTLTTIHYDNTPVTIYFSNDHTSVAPDIKGLTLTCNEGNTILTRDGLTRNFVKDFSIHIIEQDGYVFSGYASSGGFKLFDISGVISTGSGKNFMIEYECINTHNVLSYYAYIGNLDDGFDGAGGSSYGTDCAIISSKIIVQKEN